MLQLKKISNPIKTYVEFDYYVPINIIFGSWDITKEPTSYLEAENNLKNSLIEIGIAQVCGQIRSITLLSCPKIKFQKKEYYLKRIDRKIGLPFFKIDEWNSEIYLDKIVDFEVYLSEDNLIIKLSQNNINFEVVDDRVIFGFDKNKILQMIEVKNLTEEEKKMFEDSVNAKLK